MSNKDNVVAMPSTAAKKPVINMIPYKNAMLMMDAYAKHYGMGLGGEFGKFSGCESIIYAAFGEREEMEIPVHELVDIIKDGVMVYVPKDDEDVPPMRLNNALTDLANKLNEFDLLATASAA